VSPAWRDIDPVAEDVVVLDSDVTDVDADAEFDAAARRLRGIAFGHCRLYFGRASECADDTGELDQQPVASCLDDPPVVLGDLRIDRPGAERPEPAERAFLVGLDQARVTDDIGREDRCEPTFDASRPCGLPWRLRGVE
jgi:hypothetical protein